MPRADTPLREAAPVAYEIGEPVAVGAEATPVEPTVPDGAATPAALALEEGQA